MNKKKIDNLYNYFFDYTNMKEIKYQNGIIYMARDKITNKKYIGSTITSLEKRIIDHNSNSKNVSNSEFMNLIKDYGIDKFNFTIIENWPCDNKQQLLKREGYWQVLHNTKNNGINNLYAYTLPIVTYFNEKERAKEYREEHKEEIKEYNEKYRNGEKREELLEKKREYGQNNKEIIAEKNKIYRENNVELFKERKKQEYLRNRDNLRADVTCECGAIVNKTSLTRHIKESKIHKEFMENKNNPKFVEDLKKKEEIYKLNPDDFYECECGSKLQRKEYSRHQKSIKHTNFINNIVIEKTNNEIECECGSTFRKYELNRHNESKKHLDFINKVVRITQKDFTKCECGWEGKNILRHNKSLKHLDYLKNKNES
jgi:hypothetical protein